MVKETDWYPKKSMPAADRLAFYAARYPIAEADSTYYFPPGPELAKSWVERTPDGFTMNVKAYSLLTGHPTRPESLWEDLRAEVKPEFEGKKNVYPDHLPDEVLDEAWQRFEHALRPLHDAGKLGAVLFQYPQWFTPKRDNRTELARLRERLPDYRVCVEFRSPRWLHEGDDRARTIEVLAEHNLTLVVLDAPQVSGLETVVAVTTPELAVRQRGTSRSVGKRPTSVVVRVPVSSDPAIIDSSRWPSKYAPRVPHTIMSVCSAPRPTIGASFSDFHARSSSGISSPG